MRTNLPFGNGIEAVEKALLAVGSADSQVNEITISDVAAADLARMLREMRLEIDTLHKEIKCLGDDNVTNFSSVASPFDAYRVLRFAGERFIGRGDEEITQHGTTELASWNERAWKRVAKKLLNCAEDISWLATDMKEEI